MTAPDVPASPADKDWGGQGHLREKYLILVHGREGLLEPAYACNELASNQAWSHRWPFVHQLGQKQIRGIHHRVGCNRRAPREVLALPPRGAIRSVPPPHGPTGHGGFGWDLSASTCCRNLSRGQRSSASRKAMNSPWAWRTPRFRDALMPRLTLPSWCKQRIRCGNRASKL